MHATEMAEEFPVVEQGSSALEAARLLARNRLPGLVVTGEGGRPCAILPGSQVVRFLVPAYVQDDPSLAGVLSESMADHAADALGGKTVRELLPAQRPELPVVRTDDTLIEVAATMARLRSPLAAVVDEAGSVVGVITASRLLELALLPR